MKHETPLLTWLNHIAIVVPDLPAAADRYRSLGASVSEPRELSEHDVIVVFVALPNTTIELLHPLSDNSPLAAFLAENPAGGIHHLCFEVEDATGAVATVTDTGIRVLGDGGLKTGEHGKLVFFADPADFHGTLVEFEQM